MPQLDLLNIYYIISTIIICFLFCFVSYQKKLLYSWKKITFIIEKITSVLFSFSTMVISIMINSFLFFKYFLLNYSKIFYIFSHQKINNND